MTDAPGHALPPGSVIGILGGGQLGRMLAMAAARLGLIARIYDPDPDAPAGQVAALTVGGWDDAVRLAAFASGCAVVTYEFENIPPAALDAVEGQAPVRPSRRALEISRDRRAEKAFLNDLALTTAPWAAVTDATTLTEALDLIGTPAILKTATLGYDGKGQARLATLADAPAALDAMAGAPAVLEGFVDFQREVSVIAARGLSGEVVCYDPGENVHEGGILRTTTVPASLRAGQVQDAVLLAGRILRALDYVGVMGVELFVTPAGLVVNEIAPRVHNSGHWTQGGCAVDQFEQHIRAVAGWPLGDGRRHADVVMENLIGDDVARVPALARQPDVQLHLYGKRAARPGRKMGHANRIIRA
jgi:5-(carboxyamino)imidazole ribonucleotide synthase